MTQPTATTGVLADVLRHAAARHTLRDPDSTEGERRDARRVLGLRDAATEHYEQVLAEAQASLPTAPVILPLEVADIEALEVCNTEVGERYECFELGPFTGNRYLRIRTEDNLVLADRLRRLADDLFDSTYTERETKARAEMVECPGCRTLIAPDDVSCGTVRCERIAAMETQL